MKAASSCAVTKPTVTFPGDGVSISTAETNPTIAEALTAAALKQLDMPERLEAMDRPEPLTAHLKAGITATSE